MPIDQNDINETIARGDATMERNATPPDNPFAFPMPGAEANHPEYGMNLRDWFAGQALSGLCVSDSFKRTENSSSEQANWAYSIADAMLAERNKIHSEKA